MESKSLTKSILVDREDLKIVIEEERHNFIRNILLKMGIPVEDSLPEQLLNFSLDQKIKLRQILSKFQVSIEENVLTQTFEIYVDQDLVAWWKAPQIILRQDLTQSVITKQLYAEIILNFWSLFEAKDI